MLNAIYEEDFLGFSYGFRPGRGPHDALDALSVAITSRKVNHILDADVRDFFGSVSQDWLVRFLEHRVGDKRIIRLIRKWLKAGILEDGVVTVADSGTGQGSVISPLLGNIYLHYVFDLWVERWRRRGERSGKGLLARAAAFFRVGARPCRAPRRALDDDLPRLQLCTHCGNVLEAVILACELRFVREVVSSEPAPLYQAIVLPRQRVAGLLHHPA